jgi:hypothetical protein
MNYENFRNLVEEWINQKISDESFQKLCLRFDPFRKGSIKSSRFVEKCLELNRFLMSTHGPLYSKNLILRKLAETAEIIRDLFHGTNRIFTVFISWLVTGICKYFV